MSNVIKSPSKSLKMKPISLFVPVSSCCVGLQPTAPDPVTFALTTTMHAILLGHVPHMLSDLAFSSKTVCPLQLLIEPLPRT